MLAVLGPLAGELPESKDSYENFSRRACDNLQLDNATLAWTALELPQNVGGSHIVRGKEATHLGCSHDFGTARQRIAQEQRQLSHRQRELLPLFL